MNTLMATAAIAASLGLGGAVVLDADVSGTARTEVEVDAQTEVRSAADAEARQFIQADVLVDADAAIESDIETGAEFNGGAQATVHVPWYKLLAIRLSTAIEAFVE